ncbi:MAG: hypothetical protein ACYTKD_11795 [Planctomycetota bacterium]
MAATGRLRNVAPAHTAALVLVLGAGAGARAAERTVEVCLPAEAVSGLPVPVRLVVHGEAEVSPSRLMGLANPFPLTLASDEVTYEFPARRYFVHRPPRRNYHVPGPEALKLPLRKVKLERGDTGEFVFDLDLLDRVATEDDAAGEGVMPGEYLVEMTDPDLCFEYARREVRFVAPNAEERYLLRSLARLKSEKPRWQVFVERNERAMRGVDPERFSELGRRQMSYVMLLARLVRSETPIGELAIREEDTALLLPGYRTEVLILRYEIETARGDDRAAQATRAAILEARPYAGVLLDHIAERGGVIAHHRRAGSASHGARDGPGGEARSRPRGDFAR